MGLGGVGGVSTSCEASISMVVLQFGDFALFQAGKSVPAMVDCHFAQSHCPLYLPIYILQEGSDHFTEVSCKMESSSTAEPRIQHCAIRLVHTSCAVKMRHHQNKGIQSIQVPRQKPRINTFNMFVLDSMKSLLHCWFEVSVQQ
jgi:hypothetical protein